MYQMQLLLGHLITHLYFPSHSKPYDIPHSMVSQFKPRANVGTESKAVEAGLTQAVFLSTARETNNLQSTRQTRYGLYPSIQEGQPAG